MCLSLENPSSAARLRGDFLYICAMSLFLSIIIPFYGSADRKLLERCMASIREQGMEEGSYEVIVVDDGSRGLGGARNKGIRQAKGTYLIFVDADDYLFPNISCCFSYLCENEPDICSFGMCKVNQAGIKPARSSYEWQVYASGAEYMRKNNFAGTACRHFFSRHFLNTHKLAFAEACFHEDEDFVAKAYCLAATTLITDYPVYAYFMSASSITHEMNIQVRSKRLNDFFGMLCRVREYLISLEYDENALSIQVEALRRRLSFLTIDYIRQMWRNKCNVQEINQRLITLKKEGLLPLTNEGYGWKYGLVYPVINTYIRFFI